MAEPAMRRCGNCGYGTVQQYGRHGAKYGYGTSCGGGGSGAMSDTEYDNMSDEDDDEDGDDNHDEDWTVQSAGDRFRSSGQPQLNNRKLPVHDERHRRPARVPGSGPPSQPPREQQIPVPAALQFHGGNAYDSDSVCSGTFTIDLSTLQALQNRYQQTNVAAQPPPRRNTRRPYSSVSVNDPDPASYGQDPGYRLPHPYPLRPYEHQPHFSSVGRQFHDDDPRSYQVSRNQYHFAADRGRPEQVQNWLPEYGMPDRNAYIYERSSYNGYRGHGNAYDGYGCPVDAPLRHAPVDQYAEDGYYWQPSFDNGFPRGVREDSRRHDAGVRRDVHRYPEPQYRYEEHRRSQFDDVPTLDLQASQMTTGNASSNSRSQTASYCAPWVGYSDQATALSEHYPTRDDEVNQRYPPRTDYGQVSRQEPAQDRWKSAHFQDEVTARTRGSSENADTGLRPAARVVSRHSSMRVSSGVIAQPVPSYPQSQSPSCCPPEENRSDTSTGSQSLARLVKAPESVPRTSGHGTRYPPAREKSGKLTSSQTVSVNRSVEVSGDDQCLTRLVKEPETTASRSKSSSQNDNYSATQAGPGVQDEVDGEQRGSGYPDGKGEQPLEKERPEPLRPPATEIRTKAAVAERRTAKHVKFQSDPDLSRSEDSGFHDSSHSSSEGGSNFSRGVGLHSRRDRSVSDRRYQSSESLSRESSERLLSSQTSLLASSSSRSSSIAERRQVQRARSADRVDQVHTPICGVFL